MEQSIWLWIGFNLFVLAMLALDLGVVAGILTISIIASLWKARVDTKALSMAE